MKKTLIIVSAIIVAVVMLVLAIVVGILLGYSAGEDDGRTSGYDLGYDACMAKLTGDVWLVETAEETIEIADKYLDGKMSASVANKEIGAVAERYIGDKTEMKTELGNLLRDSINVIHAGIGLTTFENVSKEKAIEYNTQTLETRNFMARYLGIAER